MKCSECKFFVNLPGTNHPNGECRRLPPTPVDGKSGAFPIVYQGSWCGEYDLSDKERDKAAAKAFHDGDFRTAAAIYGLV